MKCEICNDDGLCRNNKTSPNYDDFYSDIYDCCLYVDTDWMKNYARRLQKKNKKPYISNFCKWSMNILFILLLGCEDVIPTPPTSVEYELSLYMKTDMSDELYLIDYPNNQPHSYIPVYYEISPPSFQRVFWTSPDSFTIVHLGYPITEPIINYSTYSRTDGTGKQHIYLNNKMIGDTLSIIGCIDVGCSSLSFVLF